jgi:PTH1 family peptidyl-tRNA hydrolase
MPGMRVILGIGNPGAEYDGTRHNAGFAALAEFARRHGIGDWARRWDARVADWRAPDALGGDRVLLIEPRTYVNLSGGPAQAALAFFKLVPSDLLVVVDDLNLPLGQLRLRGEGSAGGHNGLKDIEARIGKGYARLRLGIGPLPADADQVGWVLGRYAPAERAVAEAMTLRAADAIAAWLRDGVAAACTVNRPPVATNPAPAPETGKRSTPADPGGGA